MDYRGHFDLHVDYVRFKRPVAMLLVDWEPAADRELRGYRFGDLLLRSMKKTTKARKSKTMPNVWHTDGVHVRFGYRDGQDDERLYLNVSCPSYWEQATNFQPLTAVERMQLKKDEIPSIIENGLLLNADKRWWTWKAAYQNIGLFLFAHATYVPSTNNFKINWHSETPMLAIHSLDFLEIAAWEKIASQTEQGRQTVSEREKDIDYLLDTLRRIDKGKWE